MAAAFAFADAGVAASASSEEAVTLPAPPGALEGTLSIPGGAGPFPVVVILAGSGPTDRDGNQGQVRTNAYKQLADALAAQGVATLRYDKRGIAASAAALAKESDIRFGTYVSDAVAWLAKLRADKRFSRFYIAGHSEGSLLGILAAQQTKLDGLISLDGAGRPAPAILHEQMARSAPDFAVESDAIAAQLQRGQSVDDIPDALMALYRPSVQPYLISWFKYDPAAEIAKLTIPVTIVQGDADIQITLSDAKLLAAASKSTLVVVPGMSHTLKHVAGTTLAEETPSYTDPSLPIDPAVVQAIVALVTRAA
jgi:pimeloyl-ACP methyl ester carboxylesterase